MMFDIADFRWQRQTSLLGEADVTFINQLAVFLLCCLGKFILKDKNFALNKSHAYFADRADFFENFQRKD
uniref:Uncharacterized protein n=1 Tax=Chryseobacterium endophyticum TaxID=1854762 RepID=A0AAU6WU78_9FLAO